MGYNVLWLPSADFAPLLVLESDGRRRTRPLGPLASELPAAPEVPLPQVHEADPAPDITVTTTRRLSGGVGLGFLAPLLEVMGAPTIGATVEGSRHLTIKLGNVHRTWVRSGDIARYLESGAEPGSDHVRKISESDDIYVVTSVLTSTSVASVVERQVGDSVHASASIAAAPLNITVENSRENSTESTVTFRRRTPLTFAFQAIRISYEDGVYSDYASAHGLVGYSWDAGALPREAMLVLDDDLNEI